MFHVYRHYNINYNYLSKNNKNNNKLKLKIKFSLYNMIYQEYYYIVYNCLSYNSNVE